MITDINMKEKRSVVNTSFNRTVWYSQLNPKENLNIIGLTYANSKQEAA